jgi:hypothetical protein
MELAIAKSMIPLPRSAKDFHKLLSLAQQRRLAQTCEMLVGTGLSEFACKLNVDISKSPEHTTAGLFIPTLLCSSVVWSQAKQRLAVTKDMFVFQGCPMYPSLSDRECSWKSALDDIPNSAARALAGNAMSMPMVGTAFLYGLASTTSGCTSSSSGAPVHLRSMDSSLLDSAIDEL